MPASPCSPLGRLFFLGVLLWGGLTVFGATPGSRSFEVPAGDALATLKQFSAQAEVQVLFPPEQVRGVRTNAVRGALTPAQALEQMLAGTPLTITRDEKTGAFGVRRALVSPPKAEAARAENSSASRAATALAAADEAVTLSAFVVTEGTRDLGYTATNTLAGTRLNTPLNEVGTSISVVTREFLNDLAAHDSGTLLPNVVGTEVGGIDGNFAGGTITGGRADMAEARASPERNQRVRGLVSAELTRNSALTDIPFDAYNTERVTINRGPNALLFGIGSPGGVIDNTTLAPVFGSNFLELKTQNGLRGTHRASVDLNREIVPHRLGVRLAVLDQNTEYRQRPAWLCRAVSPPPVFSLSRVQCPARSVARH